MFILKGRKRQKDYKFLCKHYNLRYILTRVYPLSKFYLRRCFWHEKYNSYIL